MTVEAPAGRDVAHAHYLLRIEPASRNEILAHFTPAHRGRHDIVRITARTSYPFGFFTKSRRFEERRTFLAPPYAVDVRELAAALVARVGEESDPRVGDGDGFVAPVPPRR